MTRSARMAVPHPVRIRARGDGVPECLEGAAIEAVREEWVVEDRWWTSRPLRRRYFEVVLEDGRNEVVFRDLVAREWFRQRA